MTVYKVGDPAPPPLPRRSEAEVMARWQGDKPVVSIRCATYQHVDFIEDALRGFLGQDTDFPFEILVRDDASTDGTAEIVRDYAERYPNIIRAVLETKNRYPEVKAGQVLGPMVRGEFIALCEGDDYWTDSSKLQQQRNSLSRNAWAVVSHHPVTVAQEGLVLRSEKRARRHCRDFSSSELARGARVITCSLMYRSVPLLQATDKRVGTDMWLRARLGLHGGACWEPTISPAVHRVHPGGIWSPQSESQRARRQQRDFGRFADEFASSGHADLAKFYGSASAWLGRYARLLESSVVVETVLATARQRLWGA